MTAAVRRAAALVAVEGAGLAVLGVVTGLRALLGAPEDRLGAVLMGVLALAGGLLLLGLARALDRERTWARSPVVVLQLLALPVGYGLAQGRVWPAAVVVLGLSVGTLLALAAPEARLAFAPRRDGS